MYQQVQESTQMYPKSSPKVPLKNPQEPSKYPKSTLKVPSKYPQSTTKVPPKYTQITSKVPQCAPSVSPLYTQPMLELTHLCIDPVTVHATSQNSFRYDGQSNDITFFKLFSNFIITQKEKLWPL